MDNDRGVEAWKAHTSAFDRVRSVAQTVTEPRTAAWIAEQAAVSENTTRDHLDRLVEMNVLRAVEAGSATTYEPDPLHTRLQTLRELLTEYDHEGLVGLKAELQEHIETWQQRYGVSSPTALRTLAADSDSAAETTTIRRAANEWELTAYRLDIVEEAIDNYAAYTERGAVSA